MVLLTCITNSRIISHFFLRTITGGYIFIFLICLEIGALTSVVINEAFMDTLYGSNIQLLLLLFIFFCVNFKSCNHNYITTATSGFIIFILWREEDFIFILLMIVGYCSGTTVFFVLF